MQGAEVLRSAVAKCPFLHRVSTEQGESFALQIANSPFQKADPHTPVVEAGASFDAAVKAFHGPAGVVPLKRFAEEEAPNRGSGCPFHHQVQQQQQPASRSLPVAPVLTASPRPAEAASLPFHGLPMASMGLSAFNFLPDPGEFFRGGRPRSKAKKPSSAKKKPGQQPQQGGGGGPAGQQGGGKPGPSNASSSNATTTTASSSNAPKGPGAGAGASSNSGAAKGAAAAAGATGGQCPMRRFFGPLGGLLPLSAAGHLQCPSAIIKMRAAVAALKPVRELRPQALPIKALAMGVTAVAANVPCGVWREHTRKFSPEWFLAVHATIPFVAMLRKAVLMPKWAILLTVLGSVAGQQAGAKLERARLARVQQAPSKGRAGARAGALSLDTVVQQEEGMGAGRAGLGARRGRCAPAGQPLAGQPQAVLQLGWAPAVAGRTPVAAS